MTNNPIKFSYNYKTFMFLVNLLGNEMVNKGNEMKRPMKMHMALLLLFPMGPIYLIYFLQPKPVITLSTNKSNIPAS